MMFPPASAPHFSSSVTVMAMQAGRAPGCANEKVVPPWLLEAGSKHWSGGWWNKRLAEEKKRASKEREMLQKLLKRAVG